MEKTKKRKRRKKSAETFGFLREFFGIPRCIKLSWCVVDIKGPKSRMKLGVRLADTDCYIDVAKRQFATATRIGDVCVTLHKAKRENWGFSYCYRAIENPNLFVAVSRTYIADIYYMAIYRKGIEKEILY